MALCGRKLGQRAPVLLQTVFCNTLSPSSVKTGVLEKTLQTCRSFQSLAEPSRRPIVKWCQIWGARNMASYPPHTVLEMPALSPTMSQGNIAAWNKQEGDEIAAGDSIAEIETDKATMDWEAQDDGFVAKILVQQGTKDISVGTPVAVVVEEQDSIGAFKDFEAGTSSSNNDSGAADTSKEAASAAQQDEGEEEEEEEEEVTESSGGSSGDYPPHTLAGMPALSPTMEQGNIAKWNKQQGDEIAAGDSIAEIETDKATMDWEAQDDGFVAKILVDEGAKDIKVGQPIMVIVEDQESIGAFENFSPDSGAPAPKKTKKKSAKKSQSPQAEEKPKESSSQSKPAPPPRQSGDRVRASPYAQKLAREAGVDISQATATGPENRIVAADVEKLISSGGGKESSQSSEKPTASKKTTSQEAQPTSQAAGYTDYKDVPVAQIKKITAQRLLESKQTIPHYYLSIDCKVDKLMALRAQLNEALAASKNGGKLSVNDFVIKAAAQALKKVPQVNASWRGDFIREFTDVNIGVAVQTDVGLLVPVLPKADAKGLGDISAGVKSLATKARDNKLKPTDYDNGTFTISNLGMFGIEQFAAIINPPQAAILAVGATTKRVVSVPGGFSEASVMTVTMSCDHRVVDGAMGAIWLQHFRSNIEDPINMLL